MSRLVTWSREARKDMRRVGSVTADRVGRAVDRYVETGHGDVKSVLGSEVDEKRLKVGKVRVFFTETPEGVRIDAVKPRGKAYRGREPLYAYGSAEVSIRTVTFDDDAVAVGLSDARTISVPLAWYPRLLDAEPNQRANWELIGDGEGIHWPDVDEDLSVRGFIRGARAPGAKA